MLEWWWSQGWEMVYCRRPTPEDWIVPNLYHRDRNHTKSSGYKLWRKACEEAGVVNRSLHSTRHTFITFARRGSPREDIVEAITHNSKAKGSTLDFGADANDLHPLAGRDASAPGGSPAGHSAPEVDSPQSAGPSEASKRLLRAAGDGLSDDQADVGESVGMSPQLSETIVEAPGIEPGSARRPEGLRSRA